jgi:hypothetical protein
VAGEHGDGAERRGAGSGLRKGEGRVVRPCYLVIFVEKCGGPARPGTPGEVGREKQRHFQCRSNQSNLSNHNYKERRTGFSALVEFSRERSSPAQTADLGFRFAGADRLV